MTATIDKVAIASFFAFNSFQFIRNKYPINFSNAFHSHIFYKFTIKQSLIMTHFKISLFSFFIVISGMTKAQPILDSANNALNIGDAQLFYIADSSAQDLNTVVGSNVTWDYSTLTTYSVQATNVVFNAGNSQFGVDFPTSSIADSLGGLLIYKNNYLDSVVSQGYIYTDPALGIVEVVLSDYVKVIDYPFTFGSLSTDAIAGNAFTAITGPTPTPYSGTVSIEGDGFGTLLLGNNTYNNVLRVKVIENSFVDPGTGAIPVDRVQYLYYSPTVSKFPLLYYTSLAANGGAQTAIYSIDSLAPCCVGLEDKSETNFRVYPNPAKDHFVIYTDDYLISKITITDFSGKLISSTSYQITENKVDISKLKSGIYFILLQTKHSNSTIKLIVH